MKSIEPRHWGGVACIQWDPKSRVGSLWHPRPLLCWFIIYFEMVSCNPAWPRTLSVAKAGFELLVLLLSCQESSEDRTLTSDFSAILEFLDPRGCVAHSSCTSTSAPGASLLPDCFPSRQQAHSSVSGARQGPHRNTCPTLSGPRFPFETASHTLDQRCGDS